MNSKQSCRASRLARATEWFGMVLGVGLVVVAFRGQIVDVVERGRSAVEHGYVFLAPIVAAYLMLLRRTRLRGAGSSRWKWLGVPIVAFAFACSEVGLDRDVLILWHAAPLVAFAGLLLSLLGLTRWLGLAPGLVILLAALPVPGTVIGVVSQPLQMMATSVTAWVFDLMGIPADRLGNLIEVNGVPVAVGEACNGMRLVIPLAMVIYAFVFSLPLRWMTRTALVVLAVPVAITCNVLRLIPTSLAYGYSPDWAPFIHDLGGWVMIPLAILILLTFLRALEWLDLPVARLRLAVA